MGTPIRACGYSIALLLRFCLHWSNHRKCWLALAMALAMALLATNLVMLLSFERSPLHNRQEKLRTREGAIDLCPSSCADGTQIDNSLCPTISNSGLREILSRLTPDSVVWDWGEGASALYLAQCAGTYHTVVSGTVHCRDMEEVKPGNVRVHCIEWHESGGGRDRYIQATSVLAPAQVDVLIAGGREPGTCLKSAAPHLKPGGTAFLTGWERQPKAQQLAALAAFSLENVLVPEGRGEHGLALLQPSGGTRAAESAGLKDAEESNMAQLFRHEFSEKSWRGNEEHSRGASEKGGEYAGPDLAAMEKWRQDTSVMEWKRERRAAIFASPIPDMFGPIEGYPCADSCPGSGIPLENTVCPMMFPAEARMFAEALKPTSVVWEWGSGSSSLYFSQCVRQWTSIEHSIKTGWCGKMQELVPPNAEVTCVPIEPEFEKSFGDPGTWDGSRREFHSYVAAVARVARGCTDCVDVVLVDGRARGDCALELLPYLRPDSLVFVHDWTPSRMGGTEQYDKALEYYDVLDKVYVPPPQSWRGDSGMVKLRPKPEKLAAAKEALASRAGVGGKGGRLVGAEAARAT